MQTAEPTIIAIAGRLDVHRLDELRAAGRLAVPLVVELSKTEFIDVHALDALEKLAATRPVALAAPSLTVLVTLELTRRRLPCYPDVAAATARLSPLTTVAA